MSKNVNTVNEVNEQGFAPKGEIVTPSEIAVVTPEVETRDEIGTSLSIADFHAPQEQQIFTTVKGDDRKAKVKVYNAISAPDKKIAECIGEVIEIKDFVVHPVTLLDENTGELVNMLRTVIISADGTSYEAVSIGVANSLQRLISFVGEPSTWEEPLFVKIKQKKTRNGDNKVTLLEIVE